MNRGVIVGGSLIAASFLVAVMLNRSARQEAPAEAIRQPPAHGCAQHEQRGAGAALAGDASRQKCTQAPADSAQR